MNEKSCQIDKKIIADFLKEIDNSKILEELKFEFFQITHKEPSNGSEKEVVENYIKEHVDKGKNGKDGIYVYKKEGNPRPLYVGKGKPLYNRLKAHYRESFDEEADGSKSRLWYSFFSKQEYAGDLTVYWKEIRGEKNRKIVEIILTSALKPIFPEIKKERLNPK